MHFPGAPRAESARIKAGNRADPAFSSANGFPKGFLARPRAGDRPKAGDHGATTVMIHGRKVAQPRKFRG